MFEYSAEVIKIIDGDTIKAKVDLGFSVHVVENLRLFGLNAPEHGSPEGDAATEWLKVQLPIGSTIIVKTQKDKTEKFGRMLASVVLSNGTDLNSALIASGHAKSWDGKGQRPV